MLERRGRFREAITCHTEKEDIDREFGRFRGVAAALMNRGYAKRQLVQPSDAIKDFVESAGVCRRIGFKPGLAECLTKQALSCLDLERWRDADDRLGQAEKLHESEKLWGYGLTVWVRGRYLRGLRRPAEAMPILKRALADYQNQGSLDDAANVSVDLGAALLALGEPGEAQAVLLDAQRFYDELCIRSAGSFEATVVLAKVEQQLGHASECADWARRAAGLADALNLTTDHEGIWFARLLHEVKQVI
jgi:tetratricopeptide (TPR) repeat protein